MKFLLLSLTLFFLVSCGTQQRLLETQQILQQAKEGAVQERELIDVTRQKTEQKLQDGEMDQTIKNDYDVVLKKLNADLEEIESRITTIEEYSKDKINFRGANYENNIAGHVALLDSFNILKEKREKVYELVSEAITIRAFNLYKMAAFFAPGVYRIPHSAVPAINQTFLPALDSIIYLANKYDDIPRVARLVFVGYADESPVAAGSSLYNELSRYTNQQPPSREELNRVLSQLRANEMMRNMKTIITNNASKFNSLPSLNINYHNYGRGEAYPNENIKDYQRDDERRRIVMFYWSVLPDVRSIN